MKSIKRFISNKLIKDERIEVYSNKVKAEAFNIIMLLAFMYILADSLSIDLGVSKEYAVVILFMTGAFYITVKLAIKGLSSYSPIKGMHPVKYITLTCGIMSVLFGLFTGYKNTNLYLNGEFSGLFITIAFYSTLSMFILTEVGSLLTYYISKKREENNTEE